MKFKAFVFAALFALLADAGIFAQASGSKAIVVYYSRADENYSVGTIKEGNTAILAKMIAKKTGADMFEIVPQKAYPANYKECTNVAKKEQQDNARPAYKGEVDLSGYDTVYVGYPIWWGDLPMTFYTFLEKHDLNGKTILPFCTHEGSGLCGTDRVFKRAYKNAVVTEGLAIAGSRAQNKRAEAEKDIDGWLKRAGTK